MKKRVYDDRYFAWKPYRYNGKPCKKRWYRKKAMDKKGHTRYSSGARWINTHLPESRSYYYQFMPKKISGADDDDVLASGYTITQTWIAIAASTLIEYLNPTILPDSNAINLNDIALA